MSSGRVFVAAVGMTTVLAVWLSVGGQTGQVGPPPKLELSYYDSGETFAGPFSSWDDVREKYGATGDGVTDDTQALQTALDGVGRDDNSSVLYLPAGTYRITSTLVLRSREYVSMIGADPATTIIKWDGPPGGRMFWADRTYGARWARLTWDGSGTAGEGIALQSYQDPNDGGSIKLTSKVEHADEIFKDMRRCLVGGRMDAPGYGANDDTVTILRAQFIRCWEAGLSLESFNALQYWIWDSYFLSNGRGVTNEFGAGNFHVYRSVLAGSTVADFTIANTGFFSIRGNVSIGSRAFFSAPSQVGSRAAVTLQDNIIWDPRDTPVVFENAGPLALIGNTFRSTLPPGRPAVEHSSTFDGVDVISVGNRFSAAGPISVEAKSKRIISIDETIAASAGLDIPPLALPATPSSVGQPVIDLPRGATGEAIQAAVVRAAALVGSRPVVHLPGGTYSLNATLIIPPGAQMEIAGDGFGTRLDWSGPAGKPVLAVPAAGRVVLRDFTIGGNQTGIGIAIDSTDAAGSRVYSEQLSYERCLDAGLLADSLQRTLVELHGDQIVSQRGPAIKVIGTGSQAGGGVALFGGGVGIENSSPAAPPGFDVTNGGRLLVEDTWYEAPGARLLNLTGSGTVTVWGGHIATRPSSPALPYVAVDGFQGALTVFGLDLDQLGNPARRILIDGDPGSYAFIGMVAQYPDYFQRSGSGGLVAFLNSAVHGPSTHGPRPLANQGPSDPAFLRSMLDQARQTTAVPVRDLPAGVTDVRMSRVQIEDAVIGISIRADSGYSQSPRPGREHRRTNH